MASSLGKWAQMASPMWEGDSGSRVVLPRPRHKSTDRPQMKEGRKEEAGEI